MDSTKFFTLWPIAPFGGEDNGDAGSGDGSGDSGAGGGNDQGGKGGQGNSGSGGAAGGAGAGKGGSDTDDDDDDDEFKGLTPTQLKERLKAKEKEAKDAKDEVKTYKDKETAEERKKNDDVTNLTKDLQTANDTIGTLRATVTKQAIEAAIRDDDRWTWHDVEMVAGVAVSINPDITVSDEGKVDGLAATLAKVAKKHEFMVKTTKGSKDNKNGSGNGAGQPNNGTSGLQPGQGGTSGGDGSDVSVKQLVDNGYSAFAGRV